MSTSVSVERFFELEHTMMRLQESSGPSDNVVFVTGAGGVVGQALIRKLTQRHLVCLVHRKPVRAPNVTCVAGDVRLPQLGMSPESYDELAGRIGCIVHSAAITDFTKPEDEIMAVNVEGTRRVLELAATARVPIYHVSTAYIHSHSQGEPTPYEMSKIRSEELIKQSGLPFSIIRPSVILGDAQTGEISSFQGFHFLLGLFLKGMLPFVPALPDSYIDFVPQDFVADVLDALIHQQRIGEELWLTAGTRALRIDDIVDCCVDEVPLLTGRPLERLCMISQETYERLFRPVFFHSLPRRQQKIMDRAMTMVKYLNTVQPLPSESPELERALNIPQMPNPRATLRSSLVYWVQNQRRRPLPAES